MIHGFDIFAIGFVFLFIFVGVRRGLIGEIFRLLAMVGGVIAAILLYRSLYLHLSFWKTGQNLKVLVSFLAIYILSMVTFLLIGWALQKLIRLTPLGWIDRVGGGMIGILKAGIIIWIFLISVAALPDSAFKRSFRTSCAYQWTARTPLPVNLAKIEATRKSLETAIETGAVKPAERIKRKVEAIRDAVDSAKGRK